MNIIDGNITLPAGFKAWGEYVGIKKSKKDMALIVSNVPAKAAGCFTKNIVKAAPVVWDEKIINSGKDVKGIVVTSGNANACTGEQGYKDTEAIAEKFSILAGVSKEEVLVCATGVIGVALPMNTVLKGIETTYGKIGAGDKQGKATAEAIMTTDTFIKTCGVEIELSGKKVVVAGIAKGSGMIHPNMATLLSFITTDVAISQKLLQKSLSQTVDDTYNMISVDGDSSTNDTVLVLANGMGENPEITEENGDYKIFTEALLFVNKTLAMAIARDGEGATKLVEVTINEAKTIKDAKTIARSVVSSSLFKAALFGADANWGRVLCAMGYSGANFDPLLVTMYFRSKQGEILLIEKGKPIVFDEDLATKILKETDIFVDIYLQYGDFTATAWGCDLTYDYVKINGDYRS